MVTVALAASSRLATGQPVVGSRSQGAGCQRRQRREVHDAAGRAGASAAVPTEGEAAHVHGMETIDPGRIYGFQDRAAVDVGRQGQLDENAVYFGVGVEARDDGEMGCYP